MMYKPKQNTSVLNRIYRDKIIKLVQDEENCTTYDYDVLRWELYTFINLGTDRQQYYISRWLLAMKVQMQEKLKETHETYDI